MPRLGGARQVFLPTEDRYGCVQGAEAGEAPRFLPRLCPPTQILSSAAGHDEICGSIGSVAI